MGGKGEGKGEGGKGVGTRNGERGRGDCWIFSGAFMLDSSLGFDAGCFVIPGYLPIHLPTYLSLAFRAPVLAFELPTHSFMYLGMLL